MVISLTFLSASAVSSGTCTSSPHPSLKNMSARAHRGMAKACFTVTKSPVNNLNGSQWMSPALSRDDTIAASPNKLQLSFWGAGGPIGALETRANHRFRSPSHLPLQINIYLKISHTAWVMTNVVWLQYDVHSSWDDEAWEREQRCRCVRCLSARRYCLALIHVRRREKTLLSSFMPN